MISTAAAKMDVNGRPAQTVTVCACSGKAEIWKMNDSGWLNYLVCKTSRKNREKNTVMIVHLGEWNSDLRIPGI